MPSRKRGGAFAAALALAFLPTLTGCATRPAYSALPSAAAADPQLQALARRAGAGDKHAQLELGIRYEEGRGVARDLKRAKSLYRRAARNSGGTVYVYSPPVGTSGSGRVIPVDSGPRRPGLAEAKARLERLK